MRLTCQLESAFAAQVDVDERDVCPQFGDLPMRIGGGPAPPTTSRLVVAAVGLWRTGRPAASNSCCRLAPEAIGGQVNSLGRAAGGAVPKLAAAAVRPLSAPIPTTSNGPSASALALPALSAVAIAGAILALRRRRTVHRIDRRTAVKRRRKRKR